jgi:hypothetical protein
MSKLGLIRPSDQTPDVRQKSAAPSSPVGDHSVRLGVDNATVIGDITITYYAGDQTRTTPREEPVMPDVRQTMKKVKSGGSVKQQSSVPVTQDMDDIDAAGGVDQIIQEAGNQPGKIAAEVKRLRDAVAAFDPHAATELSRLDAAEVAARRGDGAAALGHLKGLGRWVGKIAADIGAGVLAKIIEAQMGI